MQWRAALEEWLWESFPGGAPSERDVADWVCELSDLYTIERGVLARRQREREHLAAKSLYFLGSDAPKVVLALEECAERDRRFRLPKVIVDLGCGVGATSVGALFHVAFERALDGDAGQEKGRPVRIVGVDHEPSVLALWSATVRAAAALVGVPVELTTWTGDALTHPVPADADLILCQTALNERLAGNQSGERSHDEATVSAVAGWARRAPTLVIEPALRVTTRALQRLRDRVVAMGDIDLVAPCPHASACPMLANERDWCHESRRVEPTPRGERVQRITRRRDDRALYAMLAMAPRGAVGERPSPVPAEGIWRLVSDPLGSRGKTERWVCRDDGALRVVRVLDRERSEANAPLVDAERGTLVRLPVLPESDRIGPAVEIQSLGRA